MVICLTSIRVLCFLCFLCVPNLLRDFGIEINKEPTGTAFNQWPYKALLWT